MSLKDKLSNIKIQLMSQWDAGAQMGKDMKQRHKEKLKGKKNE
jgi:hypothetical protein